MNKPIEVLPCRLYPFIDPWSHPQELCWMYVNGPADGGDTRALFPPGYDVEMLVSADRLQTGLRLGLESERQRLLEEATTAGPPSRTALQRIVTTLMGVTTLPAVSLHDIHSGVLNNFHPLELP